MILFGAIVCSFAFLLRYLMIESLDINTNHHQGVTFSILEEDVNKWQLFYLPNYFYALLAVAVGTISTSFYISILSY